MTTLVPFESAAVPAFLADASDSNKDLLAHASASFPVLSIKGKVFTMIRGDDKKILPNPRDPNAPAYAITVGLIKVSPNNSKTYYLTQFKEGEDAKPACFSNDGKKPDPSSEHPQCKTCAACKWNAFGTARGLDGKLGKGKACSDFVRIALCDLSNIHEPIMLRVPPASIKAIGEYGRMLASRKVPYQAVATEISFVQSEATPRLQFKPIGYLPEAVYREILEESKSETVNTIINGFSAPAADEEAPVEDPIPNKTVEPTPMTQPVEETAAKPEPKAEPVKKAAPAKKAEVNTEPTTKEETAESIIAQAMGNYAEKKAAKKAPKEAEIVEEDDELAARLTDLGFDD